jgi:hypothetical protein
MSGRAVVLKLRQGALPGALFAVSVLIALNVSPPSTVAETVGGHLGWARAITAGLLYIALYGLFVSFGVLSGEFTLPGGVSFKFGGRATTEDHEDIAALAGRLDVVRDLSFRSMRSYGGVAKQLEDTAKELQRIEKRLTIVESRLQAMDRQLIELGPSAPRKLPVQDPPEA